MFFLVDSLVQTGWVTQLANALTAHLDTPISAALIFGFFTLVLCNLVNNQPASILLSRVLLEPSFAALPPAVQQAAMLAVILGCNLAANLTPIGALAGLMFLRLVHIHDGGVGFVRFCRFGVLITPWVCLAGFSVCSLL